MRIAAAIERELALIEMQDKSDRVLQQVAVVADEDRRAPVAGEKILQPKGAFEVEIVGRLVEQQQVRLGEQQRRQRHAHPPSAGELRAGSLLRRLVEPEPGQNARGPRRRRVGADIDEPHLDLGDPFVIGGRVALRDQFRALGVGGEHDIDQPLGAGGRFLRDAADTGAGGQADGAELELQLPGDGAKQRGLAGAVAPDHSYARALGNRRRRMLDEQAAGDAQRNVVEHDHAGSSGPIAGNRQAQIRCAFVPPAAGTAPRL